MTISMWHYTPFKAQSWVTASTALALLTLLTLSSACTRKIPRAQASATAPEAARWNWEAYPPTSRMRLAQLPCQLLPKSSITISSPIVGVLHVNVNQPQTLLAPGVVWAEFEPAIFAAEEKAIEEARARLDEQERIQLDLELPKQKLRLERELEEAQRQFTLINLLSTNAALASAALTLPGQSTSPLRPEALGRAETEVGLLRRSLGYLQSTNLALLGIDLTGQRSEWQRRKLEFERRLSQARLKMPFDGQLTVSLPLTEGVQEYPVGAGQELAVARELSLMRLRVTLANPAWAGLPAERLSATVRLPNGEELDAAFAFQKIERVQNREESVYYFQVAPERAPAAAKLMGTDVACELWLNLPQSAHVVPKLSLVLNNPAAFQARSWQQGVSVAWPGARVLVEGQTELAVVLQNFVSSK